MEHSPITPEACLKTGRLMTEWFEFRHPPTLEELKAEAWKIFGLDSPDFSLLDEHEQKGRKAKARMYVQGYRNRRWVNGMTQQEVQVRMNEASKFTQVEKELPVEVKDRTGLEMNPLWMLETLVRSGILNPKEMIAALTTLAAYTHSKAPTISHSTKTEMTAEDWLLLVAREQYPAVDAGGPKERAEFHMHQCAENVHKRKEKNKKIGLEAGNAQQIEDAEVFDDDDLE